MKFKISRHGKEYYFGDTPDIKFDISTRINEIDIYHNILLNDDIVFNVGVKNYKNLFKKAIDNGVRDFVYCCSSENGDKILKCCNRFRVKVIKEFKDGFNKIEKKKFNFGEENKIPDDIPEDKAEYYFE